ncbi:hypothetical protein GCM10029963_33840 [Micromonospora andamanensis]
MIVLVHLVGQPVGLVRLRNDHHPYPRALGLHGRQGPALPAQHHQAAVVVAVGDDRFQNATLADVVDVGLAQPGVQAHVGAHDQGRGVDAE